MHFSIDDYQVASGKIRNNFLAGACLEISNMAGLVESYIKVSWQQHIGNK
jgi:hypothetical protein